MLDYQISFRWGRHLNATWHLSLSRSACFSGSRGFPHWATASAPGCLTGARARTTPTSPAGTSTSSPSCTNWWARCAYSCRTPCASSCRTRCSAWLGWCPTPATMFWRVLQIWPGGAASTPAPTRRTHWWTHLHTHTCVLLCICVFSFDVQGPYGHGKT